MNGTVISLPQITSWRVPVIRAGAIVIYAIFSVLNLTSLNKPKTKIKLINFGRITHRRKALVFIEYWTMNWKILGNEKCHYYDQTVCIPGSNRLCLPHNVTLVVTQRVTVMGYMSRASQV
jgi:hypothetical protein